MEHKDTAKMAEELLLCEDVKEFYDENRAYMVTKELPQMLKEFMDKKQLKKSEVIKKSCLAQIYAYQIFSGQRRPERNKLICLAVGMELSFQEVQTLLKCAGYPPLYVKRPFDCVVLYGIHNGLTVLRINSLLFECGQPLLL